MQWLERHWQSVTPLTPVLYPLSLLFGLVVATRRFFYRHGWLARVRLPVPVVIVGNVSVGGTGKTPLVLWLAGFLAERGMRPGIVSRGYGRGATAPRPVDATSRPEDCGDEPALIAQRGDFPVWVGADRVRAAQALLAAHPECDVILADDGLQHYRLERDVEISVVDGARGLGNGLLLPAGPLREPDSRLAEVDILVVNGPGLGLKARSVTAFDMALKPRMFYNLLNPQHRGATEMFQNRAVHAVAGIGNPQRFFELLQRMGLTFAAHPFPDHHAFQAADIQFPGADFVVMTEKDAVKCRQFATEQHWVLRVDAELDAALGDRILKKLERRA
ncbi:MAG: tetraacyldisaccharide 4'-kinase [Betaproteobacteria bacterium]|nr:tetraacyldisaccharide 4'-kinase [Betaproteobacteria bacterium]